VSAANEPITEMVVNSLIASPADNQQVRVNQPVEIAGVAWDGGYGIRRVEVSVDNGKLWQEAALGPDLGRFAFRAWSLRYTPTTPGKHTIIARASNVTGQTQAESLIFNPAGCHNNVPLPLTTPLAEEARNEADRPGNRSRAWRRSVRGCRRATGAA
jgi:Mo-co oxidoreductase dimerisation domain